MKNLLALAVLVLFSTAAFGQSSIANGATCPNFSATDIDGNSWELYDITSSGNYVAIVFTFSNCTPCINTSSYIESSYNNYGCGTGEITYLGVVNGNPDDAASVVTQMGFSFPQIASPAIIDAYGIAAYPTVILISPNNTMLANDIWPINSPADIDVVFSANGVAPASCNASGCTDIAACNFDPIAVVDDGSCAYGAQCGCTDPTATNFDPLAIADDGSCLYNAEYLDIEVTDIEGNTFTLSDITDEGKYLFLHFMADWNVWDTVLVPEMNQMFENYGCNSGDVFMLGINNSTNGDISSQGFIDDTGYLLPVVSIDGNSETVRLAFDISAFPSLLLVAPNEEIVENDLYGGPGNTFPIISSAFANYGISQIICSASGGCTDSTACNYDSSALTDNGSCDYSCYGCTDATAINYDSTATIDNGSCVYYTCEDIGSVDWALQPNGVVPQNITLDYGVEANAEAIFNLTAIYSDPDLGADFDIVAFDISGFSNVPDLLSIDASSMSLLPGEQSCLSITGLPVVSGVFTVLVNGDLTLSIFDTPVQAPVDFEFTITINPPNGDIPGCVYPGADNYNIVATVDDGSCIFSGCTVAEALNYNPTANLDDGTCLFTEELCGEGTIYNPETGACEAIDSCTGDVTGDGVVDTFDVLILLGNFGYSCE